MSTRGRVIFAGGPRTGKTTRADALAAELGLTARHTDDLIRQFDWSGVSAEVALWFEEPGPWIIEGVAAARALRKWLAAHPEGKPADVIFICEEPLEALNTRQLGMAKGCDTVWNEIAGELIARGVSIDTP